MTDRDPKDTEHKPIRAVEIGLMLGIGLILLALVVQSV